MVVSRRFTRLRQDRRGAVAIIAGLAMLPVLGVIGLVIDYGLTTQANAQLSAAADAAALAATTTAANAVANGQSQATAVSLGQTAGQQWFAAQAGIPIGQSAGIMNASTQAPVVTVTPNGSAFSAIVTFQTTVTSLIGQLFGTSSYAIAGVSGATVTYNDNYVAMQILMDTSSSMGIGASVTDITKLGTSIMQSPFLNVYNAASTGSAAFATPGEGCGFGCHYSSSTLTLDSGQTVPGYSNDFYGVAKYLGLTLRLDVLRTSVQNLLTQIANANVNGQLQVGLYTFTTSLTTAYAMSSDIASAQSATSAIDVTLTTNVAPYTTPAVPGTDFSNTLSQLNAQTPAAGDGSSASNPRRYLFIVTDGMSDPPTTSGPPVTNAGPMSPSACSALKAKGVQILVLYTPYTQLTTAPNGPLPSSPVNFDDAFYDQYVSSYLTGTNSNGDNQVVAALRACASQSNFLITASSSSEIDAALQKFLNIATASAARVTR